MKRMLHSKIWNSDQFTALKPLARLLYIGMFSIGDDIGRLRGDARYLNSLIFPYDKLPTKKIEEMRDEIQKVGLIIVYSAEKGTFIQHPNWTKYQRLRSDRMKASEYPEPPSDTCRTSDGRASAQVRTGEDKEAQDKGKEGKVQEGEENQEDTNIKPSYRDRMMEGLQKRKAALVQGISMQDPAWTKKDDSDTVPSLPTNGESFDSTAPQHRSSTI